MKKIVMLLCWLLPTLVNAQQSQGIAFHTFDNWQQVLIKAKTERKNIFIDAYATWCGPCKKMDAEVYTHPKIGALINPNYIAIKVQFDQEKNDKDQVKSWHKDAEHLQNVYHIEAFPTFLFINPDGELIYKEVGYQSVADFANLIKQAGNPASNYAIQIQQFKLGKTINEQLLSLSLKAKKYQDSSALDIAKDYKRKVLEKDDLSKLLNKDVRDFMVEFQQLFSTTDKSINYLIQNQEISDKLLDQKGFSKKFTDYLILKTFVNPVVRPMGKYATIEPNWEDLNNTLINSYGPTISNRLLITAKYSWFTHKQDWPNAVKYTTQYLDIQGIDTATWAASSVNGLVFTTIFMHSSDPVYLKKGISYMEKILKAHPDHHTWIDTYANLLYKIGKKQEAIKHEERALELVTNLKDSGQVSYYEEVIKKMRNNQPTWQ